MIDSRQEAAPLTRNKSVFAHETVGNRLLERLWTLRVARHVDAAITVMMGDDRRYGALAVAHGFDSHIHWVRRRWYRLVPTLFFELLDG